MRGNVIGINNAIFSPSGGSVGIGFAIPAEIAEPIVNQLKDGREIERGFLGVSLGPVTDDMASAMGLAANRGEIVQSVQDDSAAKDAGLQAGDIITSINGQDVTPEQTVIFLIANLQPGETVPLEVLRNGETVALSATLGKRPSEQELREQAETFDPDSDEPMNPEQLDDVVADKLGLQVIPITPRIAGRLGVEEDTTGLVVGAVDPNSDAGRKGLRRGDIILEANYQPVATVDALREQIEAAETEERDALLLRVQRRGAPSRFIAVRLASN